MMLNVNRSGRKARMPSARYRRVVTFLPMFAYRESDSSPSRDIKKVFMLPGLYETRLSGYHGRNLYRETEQSLLSRVFWTVFSLTVCVFLLGGAAFLSSIAITFGIKNAEVMGGVIAMVAAATLFGMAFGFGIKIVLPDQKGTSSS